MKKSNFIAEKVFKNNLKYVKLQNKTKELFFKCLDEGRSLEYFKKKIEAIWENIDYSYYKDDIEEYAAIIHEQNIKGKEVVKDIPKGNVLFALIGISAILKTNNKFVKVKEREYKNSLKSYAYKNDKQEYLKLKVNKYNNQVVPYYSKTTGEIIRYVQPSTYDSMIHNTNLTRSGWNTTLNDADILGVRSFWIPYHSFSCEYCLAHQNRVLTQEEVINLVGTAEEAEGDILHPNCKCELVFWNSDTAYNRPNYTDAELEEQYHIRQKVNTLTLRKEELLADIRIQDRLGNQDEVDKLNQKRNKINSEIRELKEALPTAELQKQVVAINR